MRRILLPTVFLLIAGCARSEDASLVAEGNDTVPAIEQRAPQQDDEEIALGEWRDALQEDSAALEFGPTGTPPLFSMRCDTARGVLLQRHGNTPAGDLPTMTVSVGANSRRLAVTASTGTVSMLRAALPAGDPLLTAISGAATPILVRIGDSSTLVLPPSPALATFLARCGGSAAAASTSGTAPPAGSGAAETNAAAPVTGNSAR